MPKGIYKRTEKATHSLETRKKMSISSSGNKNHNFGKKFSQETKDKISKSRIGKTAKENHPNWKGGITSEKKLIRRSVDWKNWRLAVFERDEYICQECGVMSGCGYAVFLEAHHIIPIRENKKDEFFNINNGITLCRPCHMKTMWKESDYQEKYSKIVAAQM